MKLLKSIILTVALCCIFVLDASADMKVKKGSFTTNNGTPPFDQSVTVGLGAAGEAVLFFWTDQTATGTAAHQYIGIGAATSASQEWAVHFANDDNVATTNSARDAENTRCIHQIDGSAADLFSAEFKSFDGTDGDFTVTWQVNPGAGRIIHYTVFGGTDLTNAIATSLNLNSTAGNQSYAHGLGATPSFAFYASASTTAPNLGPSHAVLDIGWAVSDTKRGAIGIAADDAVTMTTQMDWNAVIATDRCLYGFTSAGGTIDREFDHVSFDATNVTINQINPPTNNTDLYALFLAGGQYDAGSFTANTTTGDQNITVAFIPKVIIFSLSQAVTANRTVTANVNLALGAGTATDGSAEGAVSVAATDAVLNTQADQHTSTTKVIASLVDGNPGSLDAEADLTALGTTTTINWSDAPTNANLVIWFAVGDAAAAPSGQIIIISRTFNLPPIWDYNAVD